MLVPKRVKHRREFRGKMRGYAKGGDTISFGEYGLQATTSHWITNRQIEAARIAMTRYMKRNGQVWIKIFLTNHTQPKLLVCVWVQGKVLLKVGLLQLNVALSCLNWAALMKQLHAKRCVLLHTNFLLKLNL